MSKHMPEPWPHFIEWCEPSSPHPDSEGVVRLGFEEYRRARACVNACRGLPTDELEQKGLVAAVGTELMERDALVSELRDLLRQAIGEAPQSQSFPARCDAALSDRGAS